MAAGTLNVGFIGAGGMARSHMNGVAKVQGAVVSAVCDLDEKRANDAAREHGAKAYTDFRAMLRKENLDAVFVVVPPFAHGEVERGVIRRNLPILVEKPVHLSLSKAERILEEVKKRKLITCVGYQLRYMRSIQQAKAFMKGKKLGMIVGYYWSSMIRGSWWSDVEKSGGQVVEQATHIVDLMRDLGGEIVEVDARMEQRIASPKEGITIPDAHTVRFAYKNGALGTLTTCCMLDEWNIGFDVMLDRARLHWKIDELTAAPDKVVLPPRESFPAPDIDAVFLRAVRTGDASAIRSDYADAVRTLAVALAANRSAQRKRPVRLD